MVSSWFTLGVCGVDSGQLLFIDPCYLDEWVNNEYDGKEGKGVKPPLSYNAACHASLGDFQLKNAYGRGVPVAVCVPSGWGDGVYPVEARKDEDGRIKEVRIVFIKD